MIKSFNGKAPKIEASAFISEEMKNRTAILFPHSYLPGSARDRILSFFGTITVCQPWYMGSAAGTESNDGRITIVRPPEDLKPPEDFRRLLSEYRLWMRENQGHAAPIHTGTGEDASWEIRQAIRQTEGEVPATAQSHALKWHLILHLGRKLEEDRASADEMLIQVKAKKSPLEGALGEANPSRGFLEDLPFSDPHPSIEERHLRQILAAWFGLFRRTLPHDSTLLTFDAQVMDYAIGRFEAETSNSFRNEEEPFLQTAYLPRLSVDSDLHNDPVSAGLSGKTLILVGHG